MKKKRKAVSASGSGTQDQGQALGLSLKEAAAVFELMQNYGVQEFEFQKGDQSFAVKRGAPVGVAIPAPTQHAVPVLAAAAPAPAVVAATGLAHNQKRVTSPFVGTFYRSPSPTAEPYVQEGKRVKVGDTLCVIEAMKLMNEIEAEFSGTVVSILAENGQPVEFGEPLFVVEVGN